MKFLYDADTDSLYIDLSNRTGVDSREVAPGAVVDLDAEDAQHHRAESLHAR